MPRWTQTWMEGPPGRDRQPGEHRGARLGLPAEGPGSVAPGGRRFAALLIDVLASWLVARLIAGPVDTTAAQPGDPVPLDAFWSYVPLAALYVVGVALSGQTLGMRLAGLRLVRLDGARLDPLRLVVRFGLLCLLVPALITDRDGRGLHDRAVGSVVVAAR